MASTGIAKAAATEQSNDPPLICHANALAGNMIPKSQDCSMLRTGVSSPCDALDDDDDDDACAVAVACSVVLVLLLLLLLSWLLLLLLLLVLENKHGTIFLNRATSTLNFSSRLNPIRPTVLPYSET